MTALLPLSFHSVLHASIMRQLRATTEEVFPTCLHLVQLTCFAHRCSQLGALVSPAGVAIHLPVACVAKARPSPHVFFCFRWALLWRVEHIPGQIAASVLEGRRTPLATALTNRMVLRGKQEILEVAIPCGRSSIVGLPATRADHRRGPGPAHLHGNSALDATTADCLAVMSDEAQNAETPETRSKPPMEMLIPWKKRRVVGSSRHR